MQQAFMRGPWLYFYRWLQVIDENLYSDHGVSFTPTHSAGASQGIMILKKIYLYKICVAALVQYMHVT